MRLRVKKWESFQHYKDRSPPWIKLHHELLDDRSFQRLPDASRALAHCLWLIASESKDGIFDGSVEEIAFRVRQSEQWVDEALKPLISAGFFIVVQDAIKPLALRQQVAVPETEGEREAEAERESPPAAPSARNKSAGFPDFWAAYPRKEGRQAAEKAWQKLKPDDDLQRLMAAALEAQKCSRQWSDLQFVPHASTWLNQRRWEDEIPRETTQQDRAAEQWLDSQAAA